MKSSQISPDQSQPDTYDILITNAFIVNPEKGTKEKSSLAIKNGLIAKIAPSIDKTQSLVTVDAEGLFLTPGLIDAHTHCYHTAGVPQAWAGDYGLNPDSFSFRCGVTTVIDTGSSGQLNFSHFKATVIDRSKTRVLALLNIADWGMNTLASEQFPDLFDMEACIKVARQYPGVIVGIKVAHYWGKDWKHVDLGLKAGKALGLPLMVDFGHFKKERPVTELLEKLRKGDILTHMYRAPVPVINSKTGKMYSYLQKARDRGVLFDLGHGEGSFVFRNAAPAILQGFKPDFVSTDIHGLSMNIGCQDMLAVMSKCMAMGMPFEEVIVKATLSPAQSFGLQGLGTIQEGGIADLALFSIAQGNFGYKDITGGIIRSNQRVFCEMTLKDGKIQWDYNARVGQDYRTLPSDYGINYNIDDLVLPEEE